MIFIVGKSGSGKDYIARKMGLKMVVSRTTRLPRPGEVDGKDKHFLTREQLWEDMRKKNVVARTYYDGQYYWATHGDLVGKDAYIIDPEGVYFMLFNSNISCKLIYVKAPGWKRAYRLVRRDGWKKAIKRILHDRKAFKKFMFMVGAISNNMNVTIIDN